MPKEPKRSKPKSSDTETSTVRRHALAEFINLFRTVIVQKYSSYRKHNRICKVYIRSGKCSAYHFKNQSCDVRITQSEFTRLAAEKIKLQTQIKEIIDAQNAAVKAHKKALEDLRVTRSKEEQLRKQMDLVNRRAKNAIAVKSREIKEIEQAERSGVLSFGPVSNKGFNLHLSPNTWGAFKGFPLEA
jgi:hypothetical protein